MKILDISESYLSNKPSDHAGIFIHRQFKELVTDGFEIYVINPLPIVSKKLFSKYYPSTTTIEKIKIFRPKYFYIPFISRPGPCFDYFFSLSVQELIKKIKTYWMPDIIICDWIIPGGFAACKLSKELRKPLIFRARGADVRFLKKLSLKHRPYYLNFNNHTKKVICNGIGLKKDLEEMNIFDKEKLKVLPNGIDTNFFHPSSISDKEEIRKKLRISSHAKVITFIGSWDIHKGVNEIVSVFKELSKKHDTCFFLVVGPIRDRSSYEKIVNNNQVLFLGLVDSESVAEYLRATDIFILPSHMEGLPNSLLEAMSSGVACIASNVGGIPQLIQHGINGLLITPKQPNELKENIEKVLLDDNFRKNLGVNARRTIEENEYSMEKVIKKLTSLFSEINNGN